jgi:hypothetical protein
VTGRRGFLARLFARDDRVETVIEQAREAVVVERPGPEPIPEPAPTPEPDPEPTAEAAPAPEPETPTEPETAPEPDDQPQPEDEPQQDPAAVLEHVLDQLGQAHHRPFSRA